MLGYKENYFMALFKKKKKELNRGQRTGVGPLDTQRWGFLSSVG